MKSARDPFRLLYVKMNQQNTTWNIFYTVKLACNFPQVYCLLRGYQIWCYSCSLQPQHICRCEVPAQAVLWQPIHRSSQATGSRTVALAVQPQLCLWSPLSPAAQLATHPTITTSLASGGRTRWLPHVIPSDLVP